MSATLKQLRAFVAVARSGNLSSASAQLHITQAALSIAIRNLEEQLGGALFTRENRQMQLTPEGQHFLRQSEQLLLNWDRTFDNAREQFSLHQGNLSIAAMPSFAQNQLPALLEAFHSDHPNINFVVQDMVMERTLEAVAAGTAEVGITFRPDDLRGMEFRPLFTDRFVAIVPAAHPLEKRTKVEWQHIAGQPFVAMNRGSAVRRWTEQAAGARQLRHVCEAGQLSTIGELVAKRLGISVVPNLCREQMELLGLRCIPVAEPVIEKSVGIVARQFSALSSAAAAFTRLIEHRLGS